MENDNQTLAANLLFSANGLHAANLINVSGATANLTVDRDDITADRTDITADQTQL